MMNTQQQYQQQFEAAFVQAAETAEGFASSLQAVASAVWFDGFTPDLYRLAGDSLRRAAYVVDYLASNHLVTSDRKAQFQALLEQAESRLSENASPVTFYSSDTVPRRNRDAIAQRWQLATGMKAAATGVLDLQRRANIAA